MHKRQLAEPKTPFRRGKPATAPTREQREARKRKPVNVYVDADILEIAREMKINLSQVLERELNKLTAQERADRFFKEHKPSIDAHNAHIEKNGTLAEQFYGRDAFEPND